MFTTRQINVFRAIMATGSVTGAAQTLHLSQPSVSRLLGELERAFGATLFTRESRGMAPTAEALLFHEEVEKTYGALARLEDTAAEISQKQRGVLNLGVIAAFALEVAPKAIGKMQVFERRVSLRFRMRSTQQIIDWTAASYLDLGIVYAEHDLSRVDICYRGSVPHMALLTTDHPLSRADSLSLADLQGEPLIALVGVTDDILFDLDRRTASTRAAQSRVVAETSFAAASLASHANAIAIIDPFTAHAFSRQAGLTARPIRDLKPYDYVVIRPPGRRMSVLGSSLLDHLVAELDCLTF